MTYRIEHIIRHQRRYATTICCVLPQVSNHQKASKQTCAYAKSIQMPTIIQHHAVIYTLTTTQAKKNLEMFLHKTYHPPTEHIDQQYVIDPHKRHD